MNNVVGLHIIGDQFFPALLSGPLGQHPRIVKLLDPSVDFKARVRAAVGPDCLIVIRFWEPEQRLGAPSTDARWWYSNHVAQMLQMRDPYVAFEGYNEIPDGQASAYAQFEATRLGLMHAAGMRSVVLNASVGTPDLGTWYYYRPMLDAMKEGDFLGLHEYWPHADGIDNRWWCGRWDMVPDIRTRPIIVTECGRDYVGEQGAQGWVGQVSAEQYVAEIQKYAQVLGDKLAVVFTGGDTSYGWDKFSVNSIWGRVTEMYTDPVQPDNPPPNLPPQNDKPFTERFPEAFAEWQAAGGVEANFRIHCLAIMPSLPVTMADVLTAIGNMRASAAQVEALMKRVQ